MIIISVRDRLYYNFSYTLLLYTISIMKEEKKCVRNKQVKETVIMTIIISLLLEAGGFETRE